MPADSHEHLHEFCRHLFIQIQVERTPDFGPHLAERAEVPFSGWLLEVLNCLRVEPAIQGDEEVLQDCFVRPIIAGSATCHLQRPVIGRTGPQRLREWIVPCYRSGQFAAKGTERRRLLCFLFAHYLFLAEIPLDSLQPTISCRFSRGPDYSSAVTIMELFSCSLPSSPRVLTGGLPCPSTA